MTADESTGRTPSKGVPFVLHAGDPAEPAAHASRHGAVAAPSPTAVLEVSGPAAVDCLQGLLTNDLVTPGDGAFLYGALLTPKGMIVSDLWIARQAKQAVTLYAPEYRKGELLEVFTRSLPPRFAQVVDRSGESAVIRLVGPTAVDVATRAGYGPMEPGHATRSDDHLLARPEHDRPFALQLHCATDAAAESLRALEAAGAVVAGPRLLELHRILGGWPRIGAEIGDKTLPQEVGFDDLGGVSHAKGCYLGQETVARIHFRGHVNKRVLGLVWSATPHLRETAIVRRDRRVGEVTSAAWVAHLDSYVGLGIVRREVEPGEEVVAAGGKAQIASLPIDLPA